MFKFGIKHRIFSQSGNDYCSGFCNRLKKTRSGKAPVRNDPKLLSKALTALISPFGQFHRLLGFTLEGQADIFNIFGFYIHPCQQRQANGSKILMPCNSRDGYPHMAVYELFAVRRRCRVAMNSRTGHRGAVTNCRAIIDCHKNSVCTFINSLYHHLKKDGRYCFSFCADRADEIVERLISPADTGGSEPTGYGFSTFGKDNTKMAANRQLER